MLNIIIKIQIRGSIRDGAHLFCSTMAEHQKKVRQLPPSKAQEEKKICIDEEKTSDQEKRRPSPAGSNNEPQKLQKETDGGLDNVMSLFSTKVSNKVQDNNLSC